MNATYPNLLHNLLLGDMPTIPAYSDDTFDMDVMARRTQRTVAPDTIRRLDTTLFTLRLGYEHCSAKGALALRYHCS
jgi:hypothetical protein